MTAWGPWPPARWLPYENDQRAEEVGGTTIYGQSNESCHVSICHSATWRPVLGTVVCWLEPSQVLGCLVQNPPATRQNPNPQMCESCEQRRHTLAMSYPYPRVGKCQLLGRKASMKRCISLNEVLGCTPRYMSWHSQVYLDWSNFGERNINIHQHIHRPFTK